MSLLCRCFMQMKNFSLPMMCKMKVFGCNMYFKMLTVLSKNCSNCSVEYIWIITPFISMLCLSNTYVYNSLRGTYSHRGLDPWDFSCSCKAAAVLHPHAVLKPSTFSLQVQTHNTNIIPMTSHTDWDREQWLYPHKLYSIHVQTWMTGDLIFLFLSTWGR